MAEERKCCVEDCEKAPVETCAICSKPVCEEHVYECDCGSAVCENDFFECIECGKNYCGNCIGEHEAKCNSGEIKVETEEKEEQEGWEKRVESGEEKREEQSQESQLYERISGGKKEYRQNGGSSWLYWFLGVIVFFGIAYLFFKNVQTLFGGGRMGGAVEAVVLLLVAAGAIALLLRYSIVIVRPKQRALIERFGKYDRFAQAGLTIIIPFIEKPIIVDITEMMVNAEPQEIITLDKLNATVDAQVYFKVKLDEDNIKASQYNVYNYYDQIVNLARTTLRNIIGNMTLADANSKRDTINQQLMTTLRKETTNWGIEVVRTELKEINPPKEVQETMNSVVMAENKKVAARDLASATETEADGKRRAAIKMAEGEAEAVKIKATAEATAIKLVNEAAQKYFVGNAKELRRIEMVEKSLQNNAKIILSEKGIHPTIVLGEGIFPLKGK